MKRRELLGGMTTVAIAGCIGNGGAGQTTAMCETGKDNLAEYVTDGYWGFHMEINGLRNVMGYIAYFDDFEKSSQSSSRETNEFEGGFEHKDNGPVGDIRCRSTDCEAEQLEGLEELRKLRDGIDTLRKEVQTYRTKVQRCDVPKSDLALEQTDRILTVNEDLGESAQLFIECAEAYAKNDGNLEQADEKYTKAIENLREYHSTVEKADGYREVQKASSFEPGLMEVDRFRAKVQVQVTE